MEILSPEQSVPVGLVRMRSDRSFIATFIFRLSHGRGRKTLRPETFCKNTQLKTGINFSGRGNSSTGLKK